MRVTMTTYLRKTEFRYNVVALIGRLLLLLNILHGSCAKAENVNTNEVIPLLRGGGSKLKSIITPGTRDSGKVVVCPNVPPNPIAQFLGVKCQKSPECQFLGPEQRCCKGLCRRGIEAPVYEPPHADFFGIRRKCPAFTFPEMLPIRRCSKDSDCEGLHRICCPDKKDKLLYCRTAAPIWLDLPLRNNNEVKNLIGFVQCQSSTPPILDGFSRPCNSTIECLPNLCCQEGPKKVCRPPRRSILSLAIQATSRLVKG